MKPQPLCLLMLLASLATLSPPAVHAQDSTIRLEVADVENDETPKVHDEGYPLVSLEVTPVNEGSVPIQALLNHHFSLQEAGRPVTTFALEPLVDPLRGVSIMLVLDAGGTMQGQMERVKTAIFRLYDVLQQTDESGLLAFSLLADGRTVNLSDPFPQLDPAREMGFTYDEGALQNLLNALVIEENSGRPLYDALFKGIRLTATQARHERRAVILITDGPDTNREGTGPGSVIADAEIAIEEARRFGLPLFTIGLGSAVDTAFLQRAAIRTGGTHRHIGYEDLTGELLVDIVNQLKQTYRLTYTAQVEADNALHPLVVSVQSLGTAEATVEFKARYPPQPDIRAVTFTLPRRETLPANQVGEVQGMVRVQAEVVARDRVTAVHYYLDDSQTAVFSATTPPWSFDWDTSQISPGVHTLWLQAVTNADAANFGETQVRVLVQVCDMLCRGRQLIWERDPLIFILPGVLLLLLLFLAWRPAAASQSVHQPGSPSPNDAFPLPQLPDAAFPPPANLFERPPVFLNVGSDFAAQPAARAPVANKTEVWQDAPAALAFLIDIQRGQEYLLGVETTIGRDEDNLIVLQDPSVARRHAKVVCEGRQFSLSIQQTRRSTRVNGQEVTYHPLTHNDRVEIGQSILIFKQIK